MIVHGEKPTRAGYGEALLALGGNDANIVVFDADLAKSTTTNWFAERFPNRFFDAGIAEQNMLGMAAGISLMGKIPFVSTYGVFVAGRAWDQIRTTICYSRLNVKIGGMHGGVSVGPDGATHQALEDIASMRVLPNMTVLSPCDFHEAFRATLAAADHDGPVYLRFGRENVPIITEPADPFEIGRAIVRRAGRDVALLATGHLVYHAMLAAEELAAAGVEATVLNVHTIKPLDREAVLDAARSCGCVVTCEEHQIAGGLGGAVAELLAAEAPTPMRFIGIADRFGQSGRPEELFAAFGLTAGHIAAAAREAMRAAGK
ncbi:MAG: transketolase family protein [Myxococcales bacterium]|nr:transketolase family protein [Myxococcales bacterium]